MGGAVKVYGVAASPFVATVLLCLEEVGADYELLPLDMAAREQRTEPYLSRNPFGKIPALEDGELTLFGNEIHTLITNQSIAYKL
uniref:glutathione transferase n=1 Tax=Aegilops tauschii subsp. strangulata TaxID=200361 RepID=A0A452XZS7_AEGTS